MYVAISDIHGEMNKLIDMMEALQDRVNFDTDTLVFVGDYVDGGPHTKEVVTYLMALEDMHPHWVFLKGNHEDMMLSGLGHSQSVCEGYSGHFNNWYYQGGQATTESYIKNCVPYPDLIRSQIPRNHLEWLNERPLYYETDDFIFVHAGLDEDDFESRDPTTLLWARGWYKKYAGKPVIYGHTPSKDYFPVLYPTDNPTSIGIDTMYHGHGFITAALLDKSKEPWYDFIRV